MQRKEHLLWRRGHFDGRHDFGQDYRRLYKIPLVNILGESAYGDFNAAYNVCNFFLTISTAGLPVALSKMISEASALDRRNQVQKILRVALITFLVLGTVSFLCMSVLAGPMSNIIINNSSAVYCVMALSPAVFCVCVIIGFPGICPGPLNMVPTTVSQIIESFLQAGRGPGALATVLVYLVLPGTSPPQAPRQAFRSVPSSPFST